MILSLIDRYFIPKTILDIGANKGSWHLQAKNKWPEAYIHSVEANNECKESLSLITDNFTIALLSDSIKELTYYKYDTWSEGNSYYKEASNRTYKEIQKTSTTLDSIFKTSFDLIKLDTQGSELDILKGGLSLIENAKGIIIEVSTRKRFNIGSPLYEEVKNYLTNKGYTEVGIIDEYPGLAKDQKDILFINSKFNPDVKRNLH